MNQSTTQKNTNRSIFESTTFLGLLSGVLMVAFLMGVETLYPSAGIKFLKYVILAGMLGLGLTKLKNSMDDTRRFFKKGLVFGMQTTFFAALVILFFHLATVPSDLSIATFTASKSGVIVDASHANVNLLPLVTSTMLFFEVLILGFLVNIGMLLAMKDYARTP